MVSSLNQFTGHRTSKHANQVGRPIVIQELGVVEQNLPIAQEDQLQRRSEWWVARQAWGLHLNKVGQGRGHLAKMAGEIKDAEMDQGGG